MDDPPATPEDVGRPDGPGPVKHWYWKCFLGKTRRMATICYNYGTPGVECFWRRCIYYNFILLSNSFFFCNCLARCRCSSMAGLRGMGKETKGRTPPASAGAPQAGLSQNTKTYLRNNTRMGYGFKMFQVSYLVIFRPLQNGTEHDSWQFKSMNIFPWGWNCQQVRYVLMKARMCFFCPPDFWELLMLIIYVAGAVGSSIWLGLSTHFKDGIDVGIDMNGRLKIGRQFRCSTPWLQFSAK